MNGDPTSTTVHTEVLGKVLVVRLDREHKRNAIDADMTAGIGAALDRLDDDPELWAGVISGTPTAFSAGTDLTGGMNRTDRGGEYGVIRRVRTKPLVAAVEGLALGGGFEVVLACDLVVAGRNATFGLPEVHRSLVPTCAGMFRSLRALPVNVAREMLLTGDRISADRGERLGLVNLLTEPGQAESTAVALADRICRNGPVAVRATMQFLADYLAPDETRGWEHTDTAIATINGAADTREGVAAFLEKREPRWSGR